MNGSPASLRKERLTWTIQAIEDGHPHHIIAEALNISHSALHNFLSRAEYRTRKPAKKPRSLSNLGIAAGTIGDIIQGLPDRSTNALIKATSTTGKSVAQAMRDFWIHHHEA